MAHGREALQALPDGLIAFTLKLAAGRYMFEGRVVVGRLIRSAVEARAFNSDGGPNGT